VTATASASRCASRCAWTSGELSLAVTSVDDQGLASTSFTPVSLVPDGNETDLDFAYGAPVGPNAEAGAQLSFRSDAGNYHGQNDATMRLGLTVKF